MRQVLAPMIGGSSITPLVLDTFTGGANYDLVGSTPDIGPNWTYLSAIGGSTNHLWADVTNNKTYMPTGVKGNAMVTTASLPSTIEAAWVSGNYMNVVAWVIDKDNYVKFQFDAASNLIALFTVNIGSTLVASASHTPLAGDILRLVHDPVADTLVVQAERGGTVVASTPSWNSSARTKTNLCGLLTTNATVQTHGASFKVMP